MPTARTARPTLRSNARLRAALLGGSAIWGVALVGWNGDARASNLPTQGAVDLAVPTSAGSLNVKTLVGGVVTPGTVGFTSTGPTAAVSLTAPRTLIDWTTFHVGAGNTLNFNFGSSAADIVINRVAGGQVNVDAGGAVNGSFAGVAGGGIWFLAPNGVFLNGTVTASGVLSSNNAVLADLNLLSDNVVTLKGELSAAGTLIDLSGVETTATGVVVDGVGNIVLNDNIDTGATGVVNLASQGTITQTNGAITAGSISGTSVGGASLTGPNLFDTLASFTNTGFGTVLINDAQPTGLTVSGGVNAGFGNNLTLSASVGNLSIAAPLVFAAGDGASLKLLATGALSILQPITIEGGGFVSLSYDASSPTNLSFRNATISSSRGSLRFANADGSPASSSQGGNLNIDGQSYALLYNLALSGSNGPDTGTDDIAGIDANAATGGDAGFYALATPVFGSGTPSIPQFGVSLVGGSGHGFAGIFEGLGNQVVNLTIGNPASSQVVGLFAINSGVVRDLTVVGSAVGGGPGSIVGALVAANQGSVIQSDVGGSAIYDSFAGSEVGGLVGVNAASGIIIRGQAGGTVTGGVDAGGLVGVNAGHISGNSTADVLVTGDANGIDLGGLVGLNTGTISQSAAAGLVMGAVNNANLVIVGGLVGSNTATGTITQTLSAVAVNGGPGVAYVGGLVGYDNAAVSQSGALGAVTAPGGGAIGGLIGYKDSAASVSEVYATGAVTGAGTIIGLGPLSGVDTGPPITFGYYDILTTGLTTGAGTGLTTAQLQGVLPAGFNKMGPAWTTGPGLYPYITAIFPDGAQAISGVVYADAGQNPLGSGLNGVIPVYITVDGGGSYVTSAGANGYYFDFVDTGRFNLATGSTILTWTTANNAPGSTNAAAVVALATGTTTGLDLYANSVLLPTTATTLSALEAANPLHVTQFPTTPGFVSTQPIFVRAAGSGFDVDVAVDMSQGLTFQTTASGASITVDAPIALTPGVALSLQSAADLTLNNNLTADAVALSAEGTIRQVAGVITTGTLSGSGVDGVSLNQANVFGVLGLFTATVGDLSITDAGAGGLTVSGPVLAGLGANLSLNATGGPLAVNASILQRGGQLTLSAAGSLGINGGIIVLGAGSVVLSSNPAVSTSPTFDNGGLLTGGGPLIYADTQGATATSSQGGSLTINGQSTMIIYSGGPSGLMPTQGSVDLSVATPGSALAVTTLQDGLPAPGSVDYSSTGSAATVNLAASRTLIDWTTFTVGAGNSLNFNFGLSASDIVVNRIASGAMTVAVGGSVNGFFQGVPGGNIWFLGPGGVFLNGSVTASGVLVGNNIGLPDINLLSDPTPTLKGELAAGASLIDLTGVVTASGAAIDASQNIILGGAIDTGPAGAVNLLAQGTLTQTGGSILTGTLSGASVGGASLTGPNLFDTLAGFTNTGLGSVSITDAVSLSVSGVVDNTAGPPGGAGRDISITAPALTGSGVFMAARDIALQATTGSLSVASATAGDDVVLIALSGAVDLGGPVTASGSAGQGAGQTLFATVSPSLTGLFALGTQSIFIGANTYVNAGSPLTATNGVGIALTDARGLDVADADPHAGSWVQPATLSTPTVSLFETGGLLTVHDATVGGPIAALNLYAPGRVMVTGVLAPAVDNTVSLTIGAPDTAAGPSVWSPSQIEVINDGLMAANHGAIGSAAVNGGAYSATPKTFYAASLYATNDILLGTQAFIDANAAITSPAQLQQIDPNQPFPAAAANTSNAVLIAAGDLSLAAGRMIVQQDTAGLMTANGIGTYVTRTLALDSVGPNPPPAIDLFGAFVSSGQATPITGTAAAASSQIRLSQRLSQSGYRQLYRLNTAAISTSSAPLIAVTTVPADPTSQGSSLIPDSISLESEDAIGVLGGFDVVSRSSSRPSVAFSWLFVDGFVRYQDTDVEDLTAAGAPNEEIWRAPD